MPTPFRDKVIQFIKKVPKGRVVSYGHVAAACGHPHAARAVGGILRALDTESAVPWWRVVNKNGVLSIKGNWTATKEIQKHLLLNEGVEFCTDFCINPQYFLTQ